MSPLLRSRLRLPAVSFLFFPLLVSAQEVAPKVSLFDGKTLSGWEGNTKVWRVRDGAIVGGYLEGNPDNEYLATTRTYRNFVLNLEFKLIGTEGFVNGGVQVRSRRRTDKPNEVIGYQADIGAGHTGSLYDEFRRNRFVARAEKTLLAELEKPGEWNHYQVRCEGPRVMIFLNGKRTIDYTEREPGIETDGIIALQIHGKCKAEISFRNITIQELPDDLVPGENESIKRLHFDATAAPRSSNSAKAQGDVFGSGEVVVTMGQGNLDRDARAGVMEALLTRLFAEQKPRFRPMAWEGDTVFEQWREANFGTWKAQLEAVNASCVLLQFGQTEALDGAARVEKFVEAYRRLLAGLPASLRVVLLSPTPFEKAREPLAPDLSQRNADVAVYVDAIRRLAAERSALFVDLFTPLRAEQQRGARYTDNGFHLNAAGLERVAVLVAETLHGRKTDATASPALRQAVAEKNRMWFDCWRPSNWPFAYGDRATWGFGQGTGEHPRLSELYLRHGQKIKEAEAHIWELVAVEEAARADAQSVANELAAMQVADGYEVSLFADETMGVVKPTHIAWDERGRLFVACSPTYPQAIPGVKPGDYILLLEDTDGDGRADKATRYAEGLTMVLGLEPAPEGVYACDYDQFVYLRDTDGDDRADRRDVLFSGFGVGDTHQLINSISHGPDGSVWFTQGLHAFSRVETAWGVTVLEKAGLWRWRPRTGRLDAFFNGAKGGHNCWGVVFDDYAQMFHKSGDRPAGYYSTPGLVRISDPDEYHPTGALFADAEAKFKTNGIDIVGSAALPPDIQGCVLIAGFLGHNLELHRLHDDGAGFRSERLPNLLQSTSPHFRPVGVKVGPDGAIYIVDWHSQVIGHYQTSYADPDRDKSRGRIWRMTAKHRAAVRPPAMQAMNASELLEQLRSPERWTRYQARRLLFGMNSADVIAAADAWVRTLDENDTDFGRLLIDVTGVFQAHEIVRPELVKRLLASPDPRVRAYGCRVVGGWADRLPEAAALLRARVHDEHPRVRMEAVVACSELADTAAAEIALRVVDRPRDKFIDYALAQSLRALQPYWKPALAAGQFPLGQQAPYATVLKQIADRAFAFASPPAGKRLYEQQCLNCHQPEGTGLGDIYPPLAKSEWVTGDKETLIKIVLHGLSGPIEVAGKAYGAAGVPMPPVPMGDREIADVLTYIRSQFGNAADAVTANLVKDVRARTKSRETPWTAEELAGRRL
jgi:putative membrane-bound dehydrogenase domain